MEWGGVCRDSPPLLNSRFSSFSLLAEHESFDRLAVSLIEVATGQQEHPKTDESDDPVDLFQGKHVVDEKLDGGQRQQPETGDANESRSPHDTDHEQDDGGRRNTEEVLPRATLRSEVEGFRSGYLGVNRDAFHPLQLGRPLSGSRFVA